MIEIQRMLLTWCFALWPGALLVTAPASAQTRLVPNFIRENAPIIAILHTEVIDGTGQAPRFDQTIIIDHGRIAAAGPSGRIVIPAGATRIDGRGKTIIPGLIGMHEHMFAPAPVAGPFFGQEQFVSAPLLYLASGVTTARTAGSVDPYGDLGLKHGIDAGTMIGPDLDLSTPYLDGSPASIPQLYALRDADDARSMVRFWHQVGFTSVKAYANISPDELQAAIDEAHHWGMRVTGHLCSVGYEQAVGFGIDNLEHGPFVSPDGDLDPLRTNGMCQSPSGRGQVAVARDIVSDADPNGPEVHRLIQLLVSRHVPITSTLSVIEGGSHLNLDQNPRLRRLLAPVVWDRISSARESELSNDGQYHMRLQKEMAFERAFVAAGGLLLTGCDPTGDGHTISGLGDQRNIELLAEAGFDIPQIIRMATLNGATFEGIASEVGSVQTGKRADLVLLDGDLLQDISAIERPEIVFKAGVGYDSEAIYASLAGQVGLH